MYHCTKVWTRCKCISVYRYPYTQHFLGQPITHRHTHKPVKTCKNGSGCRMDTDGLLLHMQETISRKSWKKQGRMRLFFFLLEFSQKFSISSAEENAWRRVRHCSMWILKASNKKGGGGVARWTFQWGSERWWIGSIKQRWKRGGGGLYRRPTSRFRGCLLFCFFSPAIGVYPGSFIFTLSVSNLKPLSNWGSRIFSCFFSLHFNFGIQYELHYRLF